MNINTAEMNVRRLTLLKINLMDFWFSSYSPHIHEMGTNDFSC